ncbi:hypothetical protein [Nocardioides dongxiaopingii]|uniref:hypothetical protein n=1 Tax=Nocardioides dongxiaopingii TaxID=2576036 RepID=UPI0010C763DC|nr:hypothetical protein [Nocardioides dongxiaopingii]
MLTREGRGFLGALAAILMLVLLAGVVRLTEDDVAPARSEGPAPAAPAPPAGGAPASEVPSPPAATPDGPEPPAPPPPGRGIFAGGRVLVAYYGTGQTASLGVLGESDPDTMHRRLLREARTFARPGRPVQPVYELIVTVADGVPGHDGDYSHDVPRAVVERYLRAARRHGALLLLDVQPGRSTFPEVARRWAWALRDPLVGLALDPEWRMGPRQVPGRVIGSVRGAEVDRTAAWLARLRAERDLPEKLFVLHQFRREMITDVDRVRARPGLAMVQHVDGFGTPGQKLATYRHVARPQQFRMGFKLFYDEDVRRMPAAAVHRIRPEVRFVSFQ